jgi:YVTN family beta-propeller protein
MNKKVKKNYLIVSAVKLLLVTILFIGCKTKNQKPVIISMPSGPDSGYAHVIYNFTTLAADPDGDNIAYQFYWDDSDTSNWSDYIPSDSGFRMTKFWQAGGNYLVRVRAKDENDALSFWSHGHPIKIFANNRPAIPLPVNGPSNGYEGRSYNFSTATNDTDGDSISYQFDWGDGDTTDWSEFIPRDSSITMTKAWSTQGTFLIKARAKDQKNALTDWSETHTIDIGFNNPPDVPSMPSGPSIGYVGFEYSFTTSTNDPNGDSISYQFDWGSGDTSYWSNFVRSGTPVIMDKAWLEPGTYDIKTRARDINGLLSGWSIPHSIEIDTIDFPSRTVAMIPVGTYPLDIAVLPNGDYLYVTDLVLSNVWVIQTSNHTLVDTIAVGAGPWGIAALPNSEFVYVANWNVNTVSVIQTSNNTVIATIPVGSFPKYLTALPSGDYVYVTNENSDNVSVVRTSDNTVVAIIPAGESPSGITTLPNSEYVYVTNSISNNVSVIRTSDNTVIATIPVGDGPNNALSTPDGEYVYVTNQYSVNVSKIRTFDNTVVATIPLKDPTEDFSILPNGNYIYLTSKDVSIIRTSHNTVIGTIPVGSGKGIATSPDGNYVYIANDYGNNIVVIGW